MPIKSTEISWYSWLDRPDANKPKPVNGPFGEEPMEAVTPTNVSVNRQTGCY